jgi:hypothetical protein
MFLIAVLALVLSIVARAVRSGSDRDWAIFFPFVARGHMDDA